MVITVSKLTNSFDTNAQGHLLFDAVKKALTASEVVTIDFSGVFSVTSSFTNSSIVQLLLDLGKDKFAKRIVLTGANRQVRDMVLSRLSSETKQAA